MQFRKIYGFSYLAKINYFLKLIIYAFRFDLSNSNANNYDLDKMSADKKPDVILVKKQFADKGARNRQRKWRLHRLEREAAMSANSAEP